MNPCGGASDGPGDKAARHALIGQIRVGSSGTLKATLGSCVGIALISRDPRVCGLAHCLLPAAASGAACLDARYASHAVGNLLRKMAVGPDGQRKLRAYLCGGAHVLRIARPIGQLNLSACRARLRLHGIRLVEELETGGDRSCEMEVDCETQTVTCVRLAGAFGTGTMNAGADFR